MVKVWVLVNLALAGASLILSRRKKILSVGEFKGNFTTLRSILVVFEGFPHMNKQKMRKVVKFVYVQHHLGNAKLT